MNRRGFLGRLARAIVAAPVLAFSRPERLSVVTQAVPESDFSVVGWSNYKGTVRPCSADELIAKFRAAKERFLRVDEPAGQLRGLVGGEQGVGRQDA